MTVEELKKKKSEMDRSILNTIRDFEDETEFQVLRIELMQLYGGAGPQGRTQQATTEIRI